MGGLADLALYTAGGDYDFAGRRQLDRLADELHTLSSEAMIEASVDPM
jgi:hypothetical protein